MRKQFINSAAVFLTALFLSACSPTQRLHNLLDKHPELSITTIDTIYQPEVTIDTFYTIEKDTVGLSNYVDSIISSLDLDTACRDEIIAVTRPVTEYILSKECIEDTLYYTETITTDSTSATLHLKVFQDGDSIKFIASLTDAYTNNTKTEVTYVEKDTSWLSRKYEIILFSVIALLLILLLKPK